MVCLINHQHLLTPIFVSLQGFFAINCVCCHVASMNSTLIMQYEGLWSRFLVTTIIPYRNCDLLQNVHFETVFGNEDMRMRFWPI